MNFKTYTDIHKNDSPAKMLDLLTNEIYWIKCDSRDKAFAEANHAEETIRHYKADIEAHEERVDWLVRNLLIVLPKPDTLKPMIDGHGASMYYVCPTCYKAVYKGAAKCEICNQPLTWSE